MNARRTWLMAGLALVAFAAVAAEKGTLGLSLSVEADGFFVNPTLKAVTVERVAPGSPAEKAGVQAGDLLVELEGKPVAGSRANDLKPHMAREVGQTVRLVIRKPSGELRRLEIVAAPRNGS